MKTPNVPMEIITAIPPVPEPAAPQDEPEPVLILAGLGEVRARHLTVASVHFADMTNQFMHSGRRIFTLKAAPRDGISYLKIFDSQQLVAHFPDSQSPPEYTPMPVLAETIVADFETNWGWLMSGSGKYRLGIGRIKDRGRADWTARIMKIWFQKEFKKGFVRFVRICPRPLFPTHCRGKNTKVFYFAAQSP